MPIDIKCSVLVAYIKRQPGIATQVSVFKVRVTVAEIENQFPINNLSVLWPIDTKLYVGSLCQKAAWDCYPGVCDQGQCHCC